MKHRIVGWTEYDDFMVETEEASYAATNVVIDEIKKKGYKFYGSRRSVQKQIGNAVPALMGKAMIEFVKESLQK